MGCGPGFQSVVPWPASLKRDGRLPSGDRAWATTTASYRSFADQPRPAPIVMTGQQTLPRGRVLAPLNPMSGDAAQRLGRPARAGPRVVHGCHRPG